MPNVISYLEDAIKALFTRNTTNAASVSGARVPFVQANGAPIGNDSIANFASVLGADGMNSGLIMIVSYNSWNGDANNAQSGTISVLGSNTGILNLPADSNSNPTIILTLGWSSSRIEQVAFIGNGKTYIRFKYNTWGEWLNA